MNPIREPVTPPARRVGWPLLAVLGLGVIGLATAWLTVGSSITGSSEDQPERMVEAVVGSPARINPLFVHLNDTDRDLSSLVFSGLTRLGPNGQILPDLADTWDISPDGKQVTFRLRRGVVWQSGSSFTADDVVFTYSLLADPNLPGDPEQAPLWRQVQCTNPDQLTVVCQLQAAFAPFLAYTTVGILPKSILQGVDGKSLHDNSFNENPVGTGPYRLVDMNSERAVLRANHSYYLGVPAIEEVDFQFFADTGSAAKAVEQHKADSLFVSADTRSAAIDALASSDGVKAYTANRAAYTVLYLNNGSPPTNEPAVRRAIAEAIDVDNIAGDLLGGRAVKAASPVAPGTWAFNASVQPYDHDESAARKLLDDAGWAVPEKGDVRQRAGISLALKIATDEDPVRGAVADRVVDQLRKVGIDASVERRESTALVRDFLLPRQYQAAIFGWDPGPDPDPYPAWHSSQAGRNGRNLADYRSQKADNLMEQARRAFKPDQRQGLYYNFQQVFHEDAPSVVLYYPVDTYFVRETVKGVRLGTLYSTASRFRDIFQWKLESAAAIGGG